MTITEQIIKEVNQIVDPAYLVGGSVRDLLIGVTPKDYDFCTPLDPDTIEQKVRYAGRKPYLIGKRFGTVGFKVLVNNNWHYVEVTTFRKEKYEPNNRKPSVEFVTELIDDLSRRDLTINAIALKDGEFYDPFGGRIDILRKRIKAVGEATDRFKEDPLRILRVARFACKLDFEIDPNLVGKARKIAHLVSTISRERWVLEIDKILESNSSYAGIQHLKNLGVLKYVIPELDRLLDDYVRQFFYEEIEKIENANDGWTAICKCICYDYVKDMQTDKQLYHSVFPHYKEIGNLIVDGISARLKFSNERTKHIKTNL